MKIAFTNSYTRLPVSFYQRIDQPNDFHPSLISFNHALAADLGIDTSDLSPEKIARYFSATEFVPGSEPLAMVYAGHQFGQFVPRLGDGRAMLLGEVIAPDHRRYDIHLKGSGRTLYSRRGDGLAAIGPVLREFIVSEGMFALGVPTTRTLCAVRTGEEVFRETVLPGAVLTRTALSHLRVGTFEYFARQGDRDGLRTLADYTIERLYPELSSSSTKYVDLWRAVGQRQVKLISQWMGLGFIHGVMNTDNMSISGETIDYGPCAFMDEFALGKVFSSIDRTGRYAYGNQPQIGLWNLARLAECLILLLDEPEKGPDLFTTELEELQKTFANEYLRTMMAKFGVAAVVPDDQDLLKEWFELLEKNGLDFTLAYIDLERVFEQKPTFMNLEKASGFELFLNSLQKRHSDPTLMKAANPMLVPRNHLIERAIRASEKGDDQAFLNMLDAVRQPFVRSETLEEHHLPPAPQERVTQTFCGT